MAREIDRTEITYRFPNQRGPGILNHFPLSALRFFDHVYTVKFIQKETSEVDPTLCKLYWTGYVNLEKNLKEKYEFEAWRGGKKDNIIGVDSYDSEQQDFLTCEKRILSVIREHLGIKE